MAGFARTGLAHNRADRYDNASAGIGATVKLVTSGPGNIYRLILENNDASNPCFFQLFDAATAGAVTLGTTTPLMSFHLASGGSIVLDPLDFPIEHFNFGLCIAATTTRLGNSAPATLPNAQVWFVLA